MFIIDTRLTLVGRIGNHSRLAANKWELRLPLTYYVSVIFFQAPQELLYHL